GWTGSAQAEERQDGHDDDDEADEIDDRVHGKSPHWLTQWSLNQEAAGFVPAPPQNVEERWRAKTKRRGSLPAFRQFGWVRSEPVGDDVAEGAFRLLGDGRIVRGDGREQGRDGLLVVRFVQ